jgi:hypothetical protein
MPHFFSLEKGVKVQTAHLFAETIIALTKEKIDTKSRFSLTDVKGTRAVIDPATKLESAQPIALAPIEQTFNATYIPSGSKAATGEVRDLAYSFDSAFAKITGKTGPTGTLDSFSMTGSADLAKLREQLAQFIAMEGTKLSGALALSVDTKRDSTGKSFTPQLRVEVTQPVIYQSSTASAASTTKPTATKPVAPATDPAIAAAAPLQIDSGVLVLSTTIATEALTTSFRAGTLDVSKLKVNHYDQKDRKIHLTFAAARTAGTASAQKL